MNIDEVARRCITGSCEYLDLTEVRLISHSSIIPVMITSLAIIIIIVWAIKKKRFTYTSGGLML